MKYLEPTMANVGRQGEMRPISHAIPYGFNAVIQMQAADQIALQQFRERERNQINSYFALRARLFGFFGRSKNGVDNVYYLLQSCPWCDAPCYQSEYLVMPCQECVS